MSTQQETYRTTTAAATATKAVAIAAAITAHQTAIDASNSVAGYTLQTGNYANLAAAVKSANAAKLEAFQAAEKARQASVTVARDTLRAATGEYGY
jgi:hypothetical protein